MGLGWGHQGLRFPPCDVSPAGHRQEEMPGKHHPVCSTGRLWDLRPCGHPSPGCVLQGAGGFPLQAGHCAIQHHSPSKRPHSAQHQLSIGGGMGSPFSEVGGIQGARRTCQMLSWPWKEATNPIAVFHAAMAMLLTRGNPGVMCRDRARGQVQGRNPRSLGWTRSPGPHPSETQRCLLL